jgi:endonuclease/exonuclease/phosphatase family metal-dependent hydrolase
VLTLRPILAATCTVALTSLLLAAQPGGARGADEPSPAIRVMSFNIRYGTAKDGENHWDKRKEQVVKTIRAFDPDLLGTQETLGFQRDYLAEHLPGYEVLGVGRDDGQEKGEMMALYFKKDRFDKLAAGHFWLSETPDTAGSKSWDSSLPRMVTWVKLRDKREATAPPIGMFNTHFDHIGKTARLESARLLRRKLLEIGHGCALVVTGDFNSGEGSPPYEAFFGQDAPVVDSYRTLHPQRTEQEGTATGFDPQRTRGVRIDWIAPSRSWQIVAAEIDRTTYDGRMPSDHFPITAVLRRTEKSSGKK